MERCWWHWTAPTRPARKRFPAPVATGGHSKAARPCTATRWSRRWPSRPLAAEAINGGKVHVNKQRAKPGKEIKVGAQLSISKDQLRWEITVTALPAQRRAAKDAALLYEESTGSHAARHKQLIQQREQREFMAHNGIDHKPNKKERRLIHRFKEG